MGSGRSRTGSIGTGGGGDDIAQLRSGSASDYVLDDENFDKLYWADRDIIDPLVDELKDDDIITEKGYNDLLATGTEILGIRPKTAEERSNSKNADRREVTPEVERELLTTARKNALVYDGVDVSKLSDTDINWLYDAVRRAGLVSFYNSLEQGRFNPNRREAIRVLLEKYPLPKNSTINDIRNTIADPDGIFGVNLKTFTDNLASTRTSGGKVSDVPPIFVSLPMSERAGTRLSGNNTESMLTPMPNSGSSSRTVDSTPTTSRAKLAKRFDVDNDYVGLVCETAVRTVTRLNRVSQSLNIDRPKAIDFSENAVTKQLEDMGYVGGAYSTKLQRIYPVDASSIQYGKSYSRSSENATFATGTTPVSVMVHEYGHHIENRVFGYNAQVGSGRRNLTAVSQYGNTNSHEAFAEAFTMYCYDVKPTKGKVYYKNFQDLMKSSGLESFKGCMLDQ